MRASELCRASSTAADGGGGGRRTGVADQSALRPGRVSAPASSASSLAAAAGAPPTEPAGAPEPTYMPTDTGPVRRTLLAQAIVDTFSRRGARLGALWICIVIFFAVFAPFVANSNPVAIKYADGHWQFPLLARLFPIDVILVISFVAALALVLWRKLGFWKSLAALGLVTLLSIPIAYWLTEPPENPVYEEFREAQRAGKVAKLYRTIVPFSANDRLRDQPQKEGDVLKEPQQPPSRQHWLGTTIFGEDMLSRMIHASRVALTIGFVATGISVLVGVIIGGFMGYFAGTVDLLGMRFLEIVQSIPTLILLLIITAFFGKSLYLMMVVIGLVSWTSNARFIRAEFLKLRKLDFVQAGIAAGLPLRSILFRHMLPNGIAPVLVNASFGIAGAILLESTLSFLGLGLEAKDPSWGQLLNQARAGGTGFNWWIATFPGSAIFLTVFAYSLIGEAMRDALDPRLRKQE